MRAAPTECCIEVFPPRLPAQKQSRNPFSENKNNLFKFKFSLCPENCYSHEGGPRRSAASRFSRPGCPPKNNREILFHKIKQSRIILKFKFSICPAKTFILMRAAPTECCIEVFPPRLPAQKQSRNPFSKNKTIENHFKFKFSLCSAKTFILMRAAPDGVLHGTRRTVRGQGPDFRFRPPGFPCPLARDFKGPEAEYGGRSPGGAPPTGQPKKNEVCARPGRYRSVSGPYTSL